MMGNDGFERMWLWPNLRHDLSIWRAEENHKSLTHYGWCPARCSHLHLSIASDRLCCLGQLSRWLRTVHIASPEGT